MLITKILFSIFLSFQASAALHGDDDRVYIQKHSDAKLRELAKAVAGMFKINPEQSSPYQSPFVTLQNKNDLCPTERFAEEISASKCSGVLVGEDLLLTAGHCIRTENDCKEFFWSFAFEKSPQDKNPLKFSSSEIYTCKKLEAQEKNYLTHLDYALIRLDRKVEGVTPVRLRQSGQIELNSKLALIGHPAGLPKMIADNGEVTENNSTDYFFRTNLDAFGGNSGAPVFNSESYELEGILIRGWTDFSTNWDSEELCKNWYSCGRDGVCESEDVAKIRSIPISQFLKSS